MSCRHGGIQDCGPEVLNPATELHTPFQGTLVGAHIPVALVLTPSRRQTPLERDVQLHALVYAGVAKTVFKIFQLARYPGRAAVYPLPGMYECRMHESKRHREVRPAEHRQRGRCGFAEGKEARAECRRACSLEGGIRPHGRVENLSGRPRQRIDREGSRHRRPPAMNRTGIQRQHGRDCSLFRPVSCPAGNAEPRCFPG